MRALRIRLAGSVGSLGETRARVCADFFVGGAEFGDYRDQLRSKLTRHNVEVKIQEGFKDLGGTTLEKLDDYVEQCDAVIHLVGDMTGADAAEFSTKAILDRYTDVPPLGEALSKGVPISYTQWEAWLAIYHGKPLLIVKANLRRCVWYLQKRVAELKAG